MSFLLMNKLANISCDQPEEQFLPKGLDWAFVGQPNWVCQRYISHVVTTLQFLVAAQPDQGSVFWGDAGKLWSLTVRNRQFSTARVGIGPLQNEVRNSQKQTFSHCQGCNRLTSHRRPLKLDNITRRGKPR